MISPINTVIKNKTKELRRYRFARFHIALEPINDADGGDVFRLSGDIFTLIDNDEEAQQLLFDNRIGYIELTYEVDDSVQTVSGGKVAKLSDKADLVLTRRAETALDDKEHKQILVRGAYDGGHTIEGKTTIRINNSKPVATNDYGLAAIVTDKDPKSIYSVWAYADGYTDYVDIAEKPGIPFQTWQHKARGKQQFVILGANATPLEGAAVIIERVGTRVTDANGIAEFTNVPLKNTRNAGSKVNPHYPKKSTDLISGGKFKYHVYYPGYVPVAGELPEEGTAQRVWTIKLVYDWQDEPSENQ